MVLLLLLLLLLLSAPGPKSLASLLLGFPVLLIILV
jgi:hypothetical protein